MTEGKHETLVDKLVRALSRAVFRGEYAAGDKLPPLRKMARQHDVTVPTTQRAVARLEEMGLVSVRQGSGVRVQNPRTHVGPSALPYWIDAVLDRPDEARVLLSDFLELRAMLATDALLRLRRGGSPDTVVGVEDAVDEVASLVAEGGYELGEIVRADLSVARAILAGRPQIAFATVFNVLERLLLSCEPLQKAMYAAPEQNVLGYRAVLALLDSDESDEAFAETIRQQLALADGRTTEAFVELLRNRMEDA